MHEKNYGIGFLLKKKALKKWAVKHAHCIKIWVSKMCFQEKNSLPRPNGLAEMNGP